MATVNRGRLHDDLEPGIIGKGGSGESFPAHFFRVLGNVSSGLEGPTLPDCNRTEMMLRYQVRIDRNAPNSHSPVGFVPWPRLLRTLPNGCYPPYAVLSRPVLCSTV